MDKKAGPKDVFLQLLAVLTLYVSAGMFISLIFQYINVLIPDPVSADYFYLRGVYSGIRWSLATLIVVFPVYIWATWFLNKGYKISPEKKELKTRKWLLYFTLFLAGIVIIGDLVTLIYNLLQGELTSRFLLKILAVLAVAATIFWYYLLDLKNKAPASPSQGGPHKIFAYAASLIMFAAVVAGFFMVGSPKEERARRFDDQRVSDLQLIQSEIINYWVGKAAIPKTLADLKDDIRGVNIPKDPESGAAYDYKITGKENFKLCANFSRPSLEETKQFYGQDNWQHAAGQTCFDRKIDKDLYKPEPKR